MTHGFELVHEEPIFSGYVINVTVATFRAPDGSTFQRDLVHHPGAVGIIPLIDDDIILVKQFRPPLGIELLEIPAGLRDIPDEDPAVTANRELIEEIGMKAGTLSHVMSTHNAVGFSDECIEIYMATDLRAVERELTDSPEEQEMQIVRMSVKEAAGLIQTGEITDTKTIIGIQHAAGLVS